MNSRKVVAVIGITTLVVSLPFVVIHLVAAPDDAPVTPLQHGMAALATYFGPCGVAIVRLVDFPNAGLRSFNWALAAALTSVGGTLVILALKAKRWSVQILLLVLLGLFLVVWFGVGLRQVADGLL
jgi:hypothetical protein